MLEYLDVLLLLLFIATVSSVLLKKINFPYTIGLVIIGIAVSDIFQRIEFDTSAVKLTPDLILLVLLPALIFEASIQINPRELLRNLFPTLTLAVPGLVISTFVTGGLVYYFTPLDIGYAMLFGALISATDPVAVIALFKDLGAPKRLTMLVDCESICNDATAIVMFTVIKKIILTGATITLVTGFNSAGSFLMVFFSGIIVGVVIGAFLSFCISKAKNQPMVQIALMTIGAYAAYIVADKGFESSGVMSVLGAGIVISYYGASHFNTQLKDYVDNFWEFASFIANSFIFLLLGFSEDGLIWQFGYNSNLLSYLGGAILAVLVSRAVVVFGLCPIVGAIRKSDKISWRYQVIMFWGGLRGAVPIALVLSLDENFPNREIFVGLTLGIVLFTLLVQGTTVKWLMNRLGVDKPEAFKIAQKKLAQLHVLRTGLLELKSVGKIGVFAKNSVQKMEQEYKDKIAAIITDTDTEGSNYFWIESVSVTRKTFARLFDSGFISSRTYNKLLGICERQLTEISENGCLSFIGYDNLLKPERSVWINKLSSLKNLVNTRKLYKEFNNQIYNIEKDLAIFMAASNVLDMLEECWLEFTHTNPVIYGECVEYFGTMQEKAKEVCKGLKSDDGSDIDIDIESLLKRVVWVGECRELDNLEEKGFISSSISSEIKERLS